MKKVLILLLMFTTTFSNAAELVIEIAYQDKNVFLSNPMLANGEFCAYEITVNGQKISTQLSSSAFEINLREMGFKPGEAVKIIIMHHDFCTPQILSEH